MDARFNIGSVTMPAGEYWVGDPCYAVPDARWMEWLEAADYLNNPKYLLAEIDGKPVLGIGTAYGDGCYFDQERREYPVDAGLIGLVPVEVADSEPSGMHRMTFDQPFECSYREGVIQIGSIKIDTEGDDED